MFLLSSLVFTTSMLLIFATPVRRWMLNVIWSKLEAEVHLWSEFGQGQPRESDVFYRFYIPISSYHGEVNQNCCFCLCDVKEKDEFRELRCKHVFHKDCLDKWVLYGQENCPLCLDCLTAAAMNVPLKLNDK
ncbi:hypothetical protein ZOSMA_29G00800 [Zostera marina]|uniref:RING-type domain-containing protein n=1 Tax=Zostera marina TaxID=29655 RepID=A0A0K9PBT2_ZOSMR|nr:hypothetical protein ZOSMA_29G00800 [Zostera marina]